MCKVNKQYLIDTHIWIWFSAGSSQLSKKIRNMINHAILDGVLYLSSISLWELSMLVAKGRLALTMPTIDWQKQSIQKLNLKIMPLTPEIAVDSCHLPGEFHSDPADRIIVASARVNNYHLITSDSSILQYSKKQFVNTVKA